MQRILTVEGEGLSLPGEIGHGQERMKQREERMKVKHHKSNGRVELWEWVRRQDTKQGLKKLGRWGGMAERKAEN